MKKNIYVIYDEEADELLPPFFANNDESAMRMVKNSIKAHQFSNVDLQKCVLLFVCDVETDFSTNSVTTDNGDSRIKGVRVLSALVDEEVKSKFDNELLAQSMTKCFEVALSKFLNDNKKE